MLFLPKKYKIFECWGLRPQTPVPLAALPPEPQLPRAAEGAAPTPP